MSPVDLSGQVYVDDRQARFTGTYSYVYHGIFNGGEVAVKVIKAVNTSLRTMRRKVNREREVWAVLNHPNILPFYGYAEDPMFEPFGALISPWCPYGDASHFFARYGSQLSMLYRISLWKDAISGVAYLHSYNPPLVHGDIKPGNVLIDSSGRAVLCDFGLVRIFLDEGGSGMTTTTAHTGTERYLAPELVTGDELVLPTAASDVYALGCVGLEFIFGEKVYPHRKHNLRGCLIDDIVNGVIPAQEPEILDSTTSKSWELIRSCWNADPAGRPSAAYLVEQPTDPVIDPATS